MPRHTILQTTSLTLVAGALSLAAGAASADQVFLDDLIVEGSACIGIDCNNGESFGFDTIRLKENNLRIKFQDTSASASFPSNDWQLTANDSSNGGANKFSIDDIDGGRTPFTIEAGAPSHSLYVDDAGRVGLGTSSPVIELHVVDGDSPTLRLEQNGSSGFTAQTWDVAGNEANFFVRDVTNGSRLAFKIKPSAPDNSVFIDADGDVGLGTASPAGNLDVNSAGASTNFYLTNSNVAWRFNNNFNTQRLNIRNATNTPLKISSVAQENILSLGIDPVGTDAATEVSITGNLNVSGAISVAGSTLTVPDYVFAPDYELMPLYEIEAFITENSHLPRIPSAAEVQANGLNMTAMQLSLLEKVEELTLHTIAQQKMIDALQAELALR
jgi:hypothetical protein